MSDYGVTISLFERAGQRLAGRPVLFRLQEPVWNNMGGAAYKTLSGDAVVDVNPGADVLYTFCHECAHIRRDFNQMTPSDFWRCDPGSQIIPQPERVELRSLPREDLADQLARRWLTYAKQNGWRYFNAQNNLEAQLRALIDIPNEELKP